MAEQKPKTSPRLYLLNERHQLAPSDKEQGGRHSKVLDVDWASHGSTLKSELQKVRAKTVESRDAGYIVRAFMVAAPADSVVKSSAAKDATDGKKAHEIRIAGRESQLIERMGFDLLAVQPDGSAIVHATDERIEQMALSLEHLADLRQKDQNVWAHLQELRTIPVSYKTSIKWWQERDKLGNSWDSVIDLQAFLSRKEIGDVIASIEDFLTAEDRLIRIGTEFSGRTWIRAALTSESIMNLAQGFESVFSIHPPIRAEAVDVGDETSVNNSSASSTQLDSAALPCVAVFDTGIPSDHRLLGRFIRRTIVGEDTGGQVCCDHGSKVATRIVFGDVKCDHRGDPITPLEAACSVYDVRLGDGPRTIYGPAIDPAFRSLTEAAPDVRVINLSFDSNTDLSALDGSHRDAVLRQIADLDNRIFAHDMLVVVAAGNSVEGVLPQKPYPNHVDDPQWQLRSWPRCFNALTCGGTADEFSEDGVASERGAPSPFTRIGPGFANSPKPDFSAHAGNSGTAYQYQPGSGLGVWASNDMGLWEDSSGTSYAAPLLARDAARTFHFLQQYCESGSRPFACLVKACLALHAQRPPLSPNLKKLADRTLGFGPLDFGSIETPANDRAVFLWQGVVPSEDDMITVEIPVPGEWVQKAQKPTLRLVAAWDTPVNQAAEEIWACRKTEITVRPSDGQKALSPRNKWGRSEYTLLKREYPLTPELSKSDACLMEIRYSHLQMAPYPAGQLDFSPQQRLGIAYELRDLGDAPTSPHAHIQSLPVAGTLNRLSHQPIATRQAVSIRVSATE